MTRAAEAAAVQRQALGPDVSVWVSASAGTGKTKVLTDRLLALMLDGTDPARILCLTFTRAAAAEMANRVNDRLAAWAPLPPGALAEQLVALTGRFPQEEEIARARQLFARVLDIPGGAKIATIHAFCQSLLRRFPLEAGVPPEFAVIEERSAAETLTEAAESIIAMARGGHALLTAERAILQRLITKAALAKPGCGDARAALDGEARRIVRFLDQRAGAMLVESSMALARLGDAVLRAYEERKRLHGLLDFDDLVLKALDLLQRPGIAPWVLFKLDGGLDHILIDEAQDTNPEQWALVAGLAEEFFAGEGGSERIRTIFAVGDAKQSIYSFQHADPREFVKMRRHFEARVNAAQQHWRTVPLEISFRATEPLLQAVDAVFQGNAAADGVALDGAAIRHVAARAGDAGPVEVWPPVMPDADEELDLAAVSGSRQRSVEPRTRLARALAATIADWLATGERLEARDRAIQPGDIMVLVRRRNLFVGDLITALKQRKVPVAGADRLVLTEQLAVQDLIALGRFLLLPGGD